MSLPLNGWIREKTLLASGAIPYGRTKLRELVAAGQFPKPQSFGPRIVAYDAAEVHAWINAQRQSRPRPDAGQASADAAPTPTKPGPARPWPRCPREPPWGPSAAPQQRRRSTLTAKKRPRARAAQPGPKSTTRPR
jgi:predicted DNA-binding transcriptional regulator AlpA